MQQSTKRASDFRYYPAEAMQLGYQGKNIKLVFGVNDSDGAVFEQVGISLDLQTAKMIGALINESIAAHEEATGEVLPVDENVIASVRQIVRQSQPEPS